ncbi:MAG TPA: EamA family transporter [Marmoricola sp.]|nr:EamA family transporter [Marmoricola sp.]
MPKTVRPVWLVITAIVSVQVGAAFSKSLFDEVSPTVMVWLRLATSTVVLLAVARPRVTGRTREDWTVVLAFGAALATMNWSIYQAIARLPLGVAVSIELLGPLTLALVLSRRAQDLLWVLLAALGVAMLGFDDGGLTVAGVAFALLAAASWAAYILLSAGTGRRWPGLSGLALASVVGAVALAPAAVVSGGSDLVSPVVLGTGLVVGLLSSVVPYSLEMSALRTMPPKVFGILMSLEPAAAALAGLVLLGEVLGALEWLAISCVVVASVGVTRSAPPPAEVAAPT